ncbi:hypothetical protein PC120_g28447 [Phytophthora cactorum]|nr:hypothetical protein PC120_g28447 [Phytophthora cactorum]
MRYLTLWLLVTQELKMMAARKALLGVARGAVVCEEAVEDAQLDGLRARPVQKETKLIAVRLASTWTSAWTSMALLVKQSVLAVASVVWLLQPPTRRGRVVQQPRGKQELLRRHHIHRLSCFRTST